MCILPKRITRFLLGFVLIGVLFFFHTSLSHAQVTNSYANTDTTVENTSHTRAQVVLLDVLSSFTCQLAGVDPMRSDRKCLEVNTKTGIIGYASSHSDGLIGLLANSVTTMYSNMPAHTSDYIAYISSNFGIVKPSYAAASTGYQGLAPMIGIWIAIRNVAYLFIVLIFIFIGFAIMLRVKIDPRTVMTIENQIPKIVIGLILITFSFAIAGFLIDVMYLLIFIIYQIYLTIPGITHVLTPQALQSNMPMGLVSGGYLNPVKDPLANVYGIGSPYLWLVGSIAAPLGTFLQQLLNIQPVNFLDFRDIVAPFTGGIGTIFDSFRSGSPIGLVIDFVSGLAAVKFGLAMASLTSSWNLFGVPVGAIVGPVSGIYLGSAMFLVIDQTIRNVGPTLLAFLVVYLALVFAMLRLVFGLLTAWISILFSVALAPFQISLGLVPGAKGGFGDWLKGLAANLLVFPVTAGVFMLGAAMIQVFSQPGMSPFFIPPMLGGGSVPAGSLLAIIIIFAASQGPQMAKDMLQVKDENKYAGAFGQMMGQSTKSIYKTARGTYAAFGKVPTPGSRGGLQAAVNVLG